LIASRIRFLERGRRAEQLAIDAFDLAHARLERQLAFDALARSEPSVTLEVERAREFSPVKNREGSDSPSTSRADLCRLHAGWIAAAGVALPPPDALGVHPVEVDPLLAEDEHAFKASGPPAPRVTERGLLFARP